MYKYEHTRQQTDDRLQNIIFNKLSLGLKSIGTVSYTHLRLVIIELLDFESSSKWIGLVLIFIDLLNVDVTSIHNLSDKIIAIQNILDTLMGLQLLGLSNGYSTVTVQQDRAINRECHSELVNKLSQPHSFLHSIRCDDILYLINRVSHSVLFEIFLVDYSIIQDKYVSRHTLSIIVV